MTPIRKALRILCLNALQKQNYNNWNALLIGNSEIPVVDKRFIRLKQEGLKEEKLQFATRFMRINNFSHDYIIRLDDDDIFNPFLLNKICHLEFDIYTDKYHYYFDYNSCCISRQINYWFPNTCIHKKDHALAEFGELARKHLLPINEYVSVIENDHSKLHTYYKGRRIIFASKKDPVYLRIINRDSISSQGVMMYDSYLEAFGLWNSKLPDSFKEVLESLIAGRRKRKTIISLKIGRAHV